MKYVIWMHKHRALYVIENYDPENFKLLEKDNNLYKMEITLNNAIDLLLFFDLGVRYGMNTIKEMLS